MTLYHLLRLRLLATWEETLNFQFHVFNDVTMFMAKVSERYNSLSLSYFVIYFIASTKWSKYIGLSADNRSLIDCYNFLSSISIFDNSLNLCDVTCMKYVSLWVLRYLDPNAHINMSCLAIIDTLSIRLWGSTSSFSRLLILVFNDNLLYRSLRISFRFCWMIFICMSI